MGTEFGVGRSSAVERISEHNVFGDRHRVGTFIEPTATNVNDQFCHSRVAVVAA